MSNTTTAYYERIGKAPLLAEPHKYAWNNVLRYVQFTQDELLILKPYLSLPELIQCQKSLTRAFLRAHFAAEIDACLEVDWRDVETYVTQ